MEWLETIDVVLDLLVSIEPETNVGNDETKQCQQTTKNKTKTSNDVVLKTDCVMIILFKRQIYYHGVHLGMRKIVLIRRFCFWFLVSVSSLNIVFDFRN